MTVEGDLAALNLNSPFSGLLVKVKVKANKGRDYVSIIMQIDLLSPLAGLLELFFGTWLLASV